MNAAPHVQRRVGPALPLADAVERGVPTVCAESRRIVQGQTGVVSQLAAGRALLLVFVVALPPHPGKVRLRVGRHAYQRERQEQAETDETGEVHADPFSVSRT